MRERGERERKGERDTHTRRGRKKEKNRNGVAIEREGWRGEIGRQKGIKREIGIERGSGGSGRWRGREKE